MFLGNKLKRLGYDVKIVNADSSSASWYLPWKALYQNFDYYVEAITKGSPLFDQTVEKVMSHNPTDVVISAGCYFATTVDFGMPWPGLVIAESLNRYGVKVWSYGPVLG